MTLISRTCCPISLGGVQFRTQSTSSMAVLLGLANGLAKDQWSISAKMVCSVETRKLLAILLVVTLGFCLGGSKDAESDAKWMAPLKQYGYTAKHLKNKVEHGEFTTFELGTPNYQILNPQDEPEYITADQPHYQEMLKRLTSAKSGSETIDVEMASRVTPDRSRTQTPSRIQEAQVKPQYKLAPDGREKLKKRSSIHGKRNRMQAMEYKTTFEQDSLPDIQVYSGARPFQSRVANLN
ncbi:uncharacterized protein LOC108042859 [Drosophila rhopaloa]|uniref:Uncharacterized protein LOC108041161 n=1 Tax=Drosophila rhopaloa TaxID=1041015 RepID=A0A6P4E8W1_DRORH|nr:uncharacterized protein LOC108042859 [Drosophila rhopaloa]